MTELTKNQQTKDADGNVAPVPATPEAVRADAAAAAPKADELQKRREAVADAGLAHGSMNNHIPMTKDEFSDAEVQGDTARTFPDNVSEQTKRANKENNEVQGANTTPGQPAVGSNALREPGVGSSATEDLPEGDPKPKDEVAGSEDEESQESNDESDGGDGGEGDNGNGRSQNNNRGQNNRNNQNQNDKGSKPLSKQNRNELNATAKSRGVDNPEQYKTNDEVIKAIRDARRG